MLQQMSVIWVGCNKCRRRACQNSQYKYKKLVVRSCVDVQRVFVFLQKKSLINNLYGVIWVK